MKSLAIRTLILLVFPFLSVKSEVLVVEGGQLNVVVEPMEEVGRWERALLNDLREHLELLAGGVSSEPGVVWRFVLLERGEDEAFPLGGDPSTVRLVVEPGEIRVEAAEMDGWQAGVAILLEDLGYRWFMPGEFGRVLPVASERHSLSERSEVYEPSFRGRHFNARDQDWQRRNRAGGDNPTTTLRFPSFGSIEEHPERYALVDGERVNRQPCVTNPDVKRILVETIGNSFREGRGRGSYALSNHGGHHCECPACQALDTFEPKYGPFTGGRNVTDRYLWLVNGVLEELNEEFPEGRIVFCVVTPHGWPPARERGHANLDINYWPAAFCRIHGPNNSSCPDNQMKFAQYKEWMDRIEGGFYERATWGSIACPGFLFPAVHRFRDEYPAFHEAGVAGFRIAAYSNWISEGPSAWIGTRLLWDVDADVDDLMEEFVTLFYGPAAEPMRKYHMALEERFATADLHAGTALDTPALVTPELREELHGYLREADQLTRGTEGLYADRVRANRMGLEYTERFIAMIEARDRHDYTEAIRELDACQAVGEALLTEFGTPLLNRMYVPTYLNRFFGDSVRDGYRHAVEEGTLLVGLNDEWDFLVDHDDIGWIQGYQQAGLTGGNWQTISAWESNWSREGLGYYLGKVWYRQTVPMPELPAGAESVALWFGGLDGKVVVYVNGERAGEADPSVFTAFTVDVASDLLPAAGEPLEITLEVTKPRNQEVGSGGLTAPVFLFAGTTTAD